MGEAPKKGSIEKRLLQLSHAAEQYDIPARTLRDACILGKVKAIRLGSRWYIETKELDRLIREASGRPVLSLTRADVGNREASPLLTPGGFGPLFLSVSPGSC